MRVLGLSPDGKFVVAGRQVSRSGALLQVWDVTTGQVAFERHEPLGITAVAFDPAGKSVAYGAGDHCLVLQTLPAGTAARWNGHRLPIGGLAFSPDGQALTSFGNDGRLLVWNVSHGTVLAETFDSNVRLASEVHFVEAGRLWTRGNDGVVRWYDFQGNSLTLRTEAKLPEKFAVAAAGDQRLYGLQPDGSLAVVDAATGSVLPSIDFDDVVFDVTTQTGEKRNRVSGLAAFAVAPKSHDLAVVTTEGRLTHLAGGASGEKQSWRFGMRDVISLVADPRGRFWAAHARDGGLLVFDREHPESPQWLERSAGADVETLAAPRLDASRTMLISLKDAQTVLISEIATGRTRGRLSRPSREGANATTVTALCGSHETVFCGNSAGGIEVLKPGAGKSAEVVPVGEAAITALASSPNGDVLLAGDARGSVAWIELAASAVKPVRKHSEPIACVMFSPNGQWAATAGNDRTLVLWDVASQSPRHTLSGHEDSVQAVAFSPDSRSLVSGDGSGRLIRWNVGAGERLASFSFRSGLVAKPDPPLLDLRSLAPTAANGAAREASDVGITAIAFSGDQHVLAAGTVSGYTQTFNLVRETELSPVFHRVAVTDVAFEDDGASLLVATQTGNVSRWWRAPDPPRHLAGHQGSVRFAALDAAGRRAVTGGVDRQLRVWDIEHLSLVRALDNGGEAIAAGALSPDGRRGVTSGYGSGIMHWDLAEMKSLGKRYGHKKRVRSFDFAPDGTAFASGADDETVRIWEFSSQKLIHTLEHDAPVHFVRFSPDGTKLVTSTIDPRGWQFPARLRLWNAATGKPLVEFRGHRTTVNSAVFSPDGNDLTSCGADGQICRWKVATGERLNDTYRPHGLSHAGLTGSGGFLVMRRFSTGVFIDQAGPLTRMSEFDVPTRSIGDLNVAREGNSIIAGTEEGAVYVWSLSHE